MLFTPVRLETRLDPHASNKTAALLGLALRFVDLAVVVGTGFLAYRLVKGDVVLPTDYLRTVCRALLFGLIVFNGSNLYRSWRGRGLNVEIAGLASTWVVLFTAMALYSELLTEIHGLSRSWWAAWFVMSLGAATGARIVVRRTAHWLRVRGVDSRTAVVVGATADAQRVIRALECQPWIGITVAGWFGASEGQEEGALPGDIDDLNHYVNVHEIDQVWIALPISEQGQIAKILTELRHSTADIKMVPDIFGLQLLNHSVQQLAGLPVINLRATPMDANARLLKALEDRVLAALILLLIAPLLLAIAIGVKLSSPGPVLFKQKRHGRGGTEIKVWKFRSMRVHAESDGKVTQAQKKDPRVTRFGNFLRRSSLDELPQFINVLQGRMSIVGPRPHAVAHNLQYMEQVDDYMQRHRIKPGITGWAQVNGLRGETDTLEKMQRRVEYDLYYLQNWSLLFDLRIIAMTVFKGFVNRNAY